MKSEYNYEVIIIGAGPAGLSSALYLKRAGINPLIIESNAPGGTINKTHIVENYPGYTDKDAATLAFRMYSQIEELGVDLKIEKVLTIKKDEELYKVTTNKQEYNAKYIILATGKVPRKLDAKNVDKYEGKGISYCTFCDGALYKNKTIAVIGGGNSAMESAKYMTNIANKIYVINRSSKLRADKKEQEDVLKLDNVDVIYNKKVLEILDDNEKITGIKLDDDRVINVEGIFANIGQESNNAYYQTLNILKDDKGIIVDSNMKTNLDNLYAIGDIISKNLYQIVTAVSEGAIAASSIINKKV